MLQDLERISKGMRKTGNYHRTQMQKEIIIRKLKEQGCRITKQRVMLLDIILSEECSCCKEIYYKASRQGEKICIKLHVVMFVRWRMSVELSLTIIQYLNCLQRIGIRLYKEGWKPADI